MPYRLLADLVVLLHLGFIVFASLGALLALRWPRVAWIHVPAACWGVGIEWTGGTCPLTPLENALRRAAGEAGYGGGFVAHYVVPVVYPPGLSADHQLVLGAALAALNVGLYGWLLRRRRGRPPRHPSVSPRPGARDR